MSRRIKRSPQSKVDYLEIWLYVAQHSRQAADAMMESFDAALAMLAEHPGMGPSREELRPDLRSFPVGSYLILYRPMSSGIELLRVVHGARDLRRLFRRKR